MRKTIAILALALTLVMASFPTVVMAAEDWETRPIPYDVESGVICTLDKCYKNLSACDSSASEVLRGVIRQKMFKEGLTKEQTYEYLAQTYGEDILAAPPKKGFNLLAWVTPFVIVIAGGFFVYNNLGKWVKPRNTGEQKVPSTDEVYDERLAAELKKYI